MSWNLSVCISGYILSPVEQSQCEVTKIDQTFKSGGEFPIDMTRVVKESPSLTTQKQSLPRFDGAQARDQDAIIRYYFGCAQLCSVVFPTRVGLSFS